MTQAYLLDVAGKPVQAVDVMSVAKQLFRVYENEGLAWEGNIGVTVPFNLESHEPLGSGDELPASEIFFEPLEVRM